MAKPSLAGLHSAGTQPDEPDQPIIGVGGDGEVVLGARGVLGAFDGAGEHLGLLLAGSGVEGQPPGHPVITEDGVGVVEIISSEFAQLYLSLRSAAPRAARCRSSLVRQTLGGEALDGACQLGGVPARIPHCAQCGAYMLDRSHDAVDALRWW